MNPYEISQAASDAIQSLLDKAEQLGGLSQTQPVSQALKDRLLQLQHVQAKSWHALRHNNEQVEFIMARLESMDVLCGRLLPVMEVAERITRKRLSKQKVKLSSSASTSARVKSKGRWGFGRDELVDLVEAVVKALRTWLDFHEAIYELLASRPFGASCEAFGIFPRLQTLTLEGFQAVPAVMSKINEYLTTQQAVIICGPSGVGKTSLAAYVASRPPDLLSDGAIEVHFGKVCTLDRGEEVYHQNLLVKLQLLLHDANCQQKVQNVDEAWNLLEEVLEESAYLLILDDVWEKEILNKFFQLRSHSCKLLVTCEDEPAYTSSSTTVSVVHLGFNEVASASREILLFHCGAFESETMPAAGSKLLRFCSNHPLSVSVVGEALRSRRSKDWPTVLELFRKKVGEPVNWITGVFCAIDFSLADMNLETQSLFQAFASLCWEEPIPLDCLKSLWGAVGNKSSLLLQTRELVRRCLLRRSPNFESYSVHELIVTYLEARGSQAVEVLLKNSEPGTKAALSPWLVQYGNHEAKEVAEAVVRAMLALQDEELHAKVLVTVVDVFNSCSSSSRELVSKQFNNLVGPEIIDLFCNAASPSTHSAIVKYMSTCFSDAEYDEYGRGLVASGVLGVLRLLLCSNNIGGVDLLVRNAAADVLGKLAETGDSYVIEGVIQAKLIHDLVSQLEPKSGLVHEGLITAIVRIAENGEATVEPILETGLIDKLLKLLQSRKNGLKFRAMSTLQSLVIAGGDRMSSCMLEQGVLEELVPLLNSQSEDVRFGAAQLCQQLVTGCGSMMERVLKMKLPETLTELLKDEIDLARSSAAESLRSLVRAGGQPVVDRISKVAAYVRTSLEAEEAAEFEVMVSSIIEQPLPECS